MLHTGYKRGKGRGYQRGGYSPRGYHNGYRPREITDWYFHARAMHSAVRDLARRPLLINGVRGRPAWAYLASDIFGATWQPAIGGAPLARSGLAPTIAPSAMPSKLDAILDGTTAFVSTDTALGNFGAEKYVVKVCFQAVSGTAILLDLKGDLPLANDGLLVYLDALRVKAAYSDGAAQVAIQSGTLTEGYWYHATLTVDPARADGFRLYVGPVLDSTPANPTALGAVSPDRVLALGAYNTATTGIAGRLAAAMCWRSPSATWLADNAEILSRIERDHLALFDMHDRKSDATVLSMGRASVAHVTRIGDGGRLETIPVGGHIPAVCDRPAANGRTARGLVSLPQVINELTAPTDLGNAAWTKAVSVIDVTTNTIPSSKRGTNLQGIVCTGTAQHTITQAVIVFADTGLATFSAEVYPGEQPWFYLQVPTTTNAWGYFNASTLAVGNLGAAVVLAQVEDMKDGRVRISITCTISVVTQTMVLAPSNANGGAAVPSYAGHGTNPEAYAGLAMGVRWAWSLPYFGGTRAADTLFFDPTSIAGFDPDRKRGTIAFRFNVPAGGDITPSSYQLGLSDGIVRDVDCIRGYCTGGEKVGAFVSEVAGPPPYEAINDPTMDINDGLDHEGGMTWDDGTPHRGYRDRRLGTSNPVNSTLPDDLDRIPVGHAEDSQTQGGFPASNFRLSEHVRP